MAINDRRDLGAAGSISQTPGAQGMPLPRTAMETFDDNWFRLYYAGRPYATADAGYEFYEPAYRFGHGARRRHAGRSWDEAEPELFSEWEAKKDGPEYVSWDRVKAAIRDAWDVSGPERDRTER